MPNANDDTDDGAGDGERRMDVPVGLLRAEFGVLLNETDPTDPFSSAAPRPSRDRMASMALALSAASSSNFLHRSTSCAICWSLLWRIASHALSIWFSSRTSLLRFSTLARSSEHSAWSMSAFAWPL